MPTSSHTRRDVILTTGAVLLAAGATALAQTTQLAPPDKQPPDLNVPKPKSMAGWALVGLGQLALEEIAPAFGSCKRSRLVALVSGHPDKAKTVAAAYGVKPGSIYSYDNFDSIRDNPDVDVIYVVLPNSMHAEFTVRAAKAGKHVFCEKPMAVTVSECRQMIDACNAAGKKLAVAYRLQYEPHHLQAIEMCRTKEFGKIRTIEASNGQVTKAPNIRLTKALGGGPVGDVGVYCINAARYLTGEEPTEVFATAQQPTDDPRFKEVPEGVAFTLRFPSGVIAYCGCSFGSAESRRLRVHCTDGWIEIDPAFSYKNLVLKTMKEKGKTQHDIMPVDHFATEMDAFSETVLDDKAVKTPGEEGMKDMMVVESIYKSMETNQVVRIG